MKIQYVNHLGPAEDDDIERMAQAHQRYATELAIDHGLEPPVITFVRGAAKPADDADELGFFEHPDVANALGYHDRDRRGRPYGKVFRSVIPGRVMLHDTSGHGASAAGCASHELAEMLGDRFANLWAFGRILDPRSRRTFGAQAYELADPVQDAAFQHPADDGVAVDCSDYVLPNYFNPDTPATEKTSRTGAAVGPFTVAPGGYAIVAQETRETQIFGRSIDEPLERVKHAEVEPPAWREAIRALPYSRSARRHRAQAAA